MFGDSVIVPGWSAPNDTRPASVPRRNVAAPAGFAGVSGLPPASRSSYTVCATVPTSGTGMSFSTLIVKPPVSGMKSPSASVATMTDDKSMAISASSSSFDAQPVVELVQQRERVRARRRW